ncbi:hypothetical protein LJK88_30210 [Paenibacillus sp. P26]|nr:hypothetical protein LJK88_30210 [Paenibacillus sp. P26]
MGDLQAGVLRCVGEASERFREDALRMLRCIRFAAEYGLRVEEGTWNALRENIPLLRHIAMERVRAELERMIEGDRPGEAIRSLVSSQALRHTKSTLLLTCIEEQTGRTDWDGLQEADLRWTCLYLQLGVTRADAEEDLKKLTFPRWRIDRVGACLERMLFYGKGYTMFLIREQQRRPVRRERNRCMMTICGGYGFLQRCASDVRLWPGWRSFTAFVAVLWIIGKNRDAIRG